MAMKLQNGVLKNCSTVFFLFFFFWGGGGGWGVFQKIIRGQDILKNSKGFLFGSLV